MARSRRQLESANVHAAVPDGDAFLRLRGIVKRFPGVQALGGVDVDFAAGRVHALLGENGAGKSTLVKILGGIYRPDEGEVLVRGRPARFATPFDSEQAGIAVVHQHRMLVPSMSVAENLLIGRLGPAASTFNRRRAHDDARRLLREVGLEVDPAVLVERLSPAAQQMLEIARALSRDARCIIFDEPTTSLTPPESDILFARIADLRSRGIAVVYISHDLDDALAISDDITVLRDGRLAGRLDAAAADVDAIVQLMIGRSLAQSFPRRREPGDETVLRLRDVRTGVLAGVSLDVRRGELVCLAGLVGSGRTETLRAVFGLDRVEHGDIEYFGRSATMRNPRQAIRGRIGFVPEDRKEQGLVLPMSVTENIVLGNEAGFRRGGLLSGRAQAAVSRRMVKDLAIKVASPGQVVGGLSGGNQQKVILGRWLAREVDLLLIDEPTVGIDVGARGEFYRLLDDFAAAGGSALIVSSDLSEVLGLADRVVVMRAGRSVAELTGGRMNREEAMRAMAVAA
jgi:ribose transport system ATP-binding protein